jgi:hypothetical protein
VIPQVVPFILGVDLTVPAMAGHLAVAILVIAGMVVFRFVTLLPVELTKPVLRLILVLVQLDGMVRIVTSALPTIMVKHAMRVFRVVITRVMMV